MDFSWCPMSLVSVEVVSWRHISFNKMNIWSILQMSSSFAMFNLKPWCLRVSDDMNIIFIFQREYHLIQVWNNFIFEHWFALFFLTICLLLFSLVRPLTTSLVYKIKKKAFSFKKAPNKTTLWENKSGDTVYGHRGTRNPGKRGQHFFQRAWC